MKKLILCTLIITSGYAAAYQKVCATISSNNTDMINDDGFKNPPFWHFEYTKTTNDIRCVKAPCPSSGQKKRCFVTLDQDEIKALLKNLREFSDETLVLKTFVAVPKNNRRGMSPIARAQEVIANTGASRLTVGELRKKIENPSKSSN